MRNPVSAIRRSAMSRIDFVRVRLVWERALFTIVLLYLTAAMLLDPRKEILYIPSAALAVALAMAGVAFSYARTFRDDDTVRVEVTYAGEKFVHAGMLFLLASLLKYGAIDLPGHLELMARVLGASRRAESLIFFTTR